MQCAFIRFYAKDNNTPNRCALMHIASSAYATAGRTYKIVRYLEADQGVVLAVCQRVVQ
jgi:hypothetical protein